MKRQELITIMEAALTARLWTYAADVARSLLAGWPNDLEALYGLARALAPTAPEQATETLQRLVAADGQDAVALILLADLLRSQGRTYEADAALAAVLALNPDAASTRAALQNPPAWLDAAVNARRAMQRDDAEAAFQALYPLAQARPTQPDAAPQAAWLCLLEAAWRSAQWDSLRTLATRARSLWPDAVLPGLLLGAVWMRAGEYDQGMVLLHNAATLDPAGQVPVRLWGPGHPYRHLWPPPAPVELPGPLPAGIAALLGRNQLPGGVAIEAGDAKQETPPAASAEDWMADIQARFEEVAAVAALRPRVFRKSATAPASSAPQQAKQAPVQEARPDGDKPPRAHKAALAVDALHRAVTDLAAEAAGIKPKTKEQQPVHVILSHRGKLAARHGSEGAARLDKALRELATLTKADTGMMTDVVYVDDAQSLEAYALEPVESPAAPEAIKALLTALDDTLKAESGALVSLLIVGDDGVIPFHRVPNPVEDDEPEILTDAPYATRCDDPLLGERAVGRLPQTGTAALEAAIAHAVEAHRGVKPRRGAWWRAILGWLKSRFGRASDSSALAGCLGYTASAWQDAARAVYQVLGDSGELHTSPPVNADRWLAEGLLPARYGYFNLHGQRDSAEWYGQRSATDGTIYPYFPVALSPAHVTNGGGAPRVVFTEACYGAHVLGKSADDALALRFMECGTLGVVGATCIAYGSVNSAPLVGADLLARRFWERLLVGYSQGRALRDAKILFAKELERRHGFLDEDDQKTLLGFVLYGDPTLSPEAARGRSMPKSVRIASAVQLPEVVRAAPLEMAPPETVPNQVIQQVKGLMAPFLPGAHEAQVNLAVPKRTDAGTHAKSAGPAPSAVLILRKAHRLGDAHPWQQLARITLDNAGRVTKTTITRGGV